MKMIVKIENEIRNLDVIKVENIDQITDKYLGKDGIIPTLYREICVVEKKDMSNCLKRLMELRQKFNQIVKGFQSNFG
jgi:hypothetical protein